jgi:predicted aspartyl protease
VTGDRIVAVVAIVAMLILVVPRMGARGLPAHRVIKLALIWAVIFLAAIAIVMLMGRGL